MSYHHHIGNVTLLFASAPFGWNATPFIWIPGAITAHYIIAYIRSFDGAFVVSLLGNLVGILVPSWYLSR